MTDLVVFRVGDNRYALRIENIQRIIQAVALTNIPNAHPFVDGIMSYEDSVIKIMNFRKTIGLPSYLEELEALFARLKNDHLTWVESLNNSLQTGVKFDKTFNSHMCELGKWIDGFTAYDDRVSEVLKELVDHHKTLHKKGAEACEMNLSNQAEARRIYDLEITEVFNKTMGALDTFVRELSLVSDSLQKFLIYEKDGKTFAIKVDVIEDIAHIEENDIMNSDSKEEDSDFLELDGVLDINNVLINVIKTVNLPK